MQIGLKYYFTHFEKELAEVREGVMVGSSISSTGYELIMLKVGKSKVPVERAMVFEHKADADVALANFSPIREEMKSLQVKTQEILDGMRKKIIGEPIHKDLIEEAA